MKLNIDEMAAIASAIMRNETIRPFQERALALAIIDLAQHSDALRVLAHDLGRCDSPADWNQEAMDALWGLVEVRR